MIMQLQNNEAMCYCVHVRPCKAGGIATSLRRNHRLLKVRKSGCGLSRTLSQVAITLQWKLPDFVSEMLFHIQWYIETVNLLKSKISDEILVSFSRSQSHANPQEAEVKKKASCYDTKHGCICQKWIQKFFSSLMWRKLGLELRF